MDNEAFTRRIEQIKDSPTAIYKLDKKDPEKKNGVNIVVTVDDPGGWNVANPLLKELVASSQVSSVTTVSSGSARSSFQESYGQLFTRIGSDTNPSLYREFEKLPPFDIAIAMVTEQNASNVPFLYGGIQTKRIIYIWDAWSPETGGPFLNPDEVDWQKTKIVCNDELAKAIIVHSLSERASDSEKMEKYLKNNVYPIGTPILEQVKLEERKELRESGRKALGLSDDTFAFLYGAQIDVDYADKGFNPQINRETLKLTLEGFRIFAKAYPDRKLAFLIRTHPRDPKGQELIDLAKEYDFPDNVKVIAANKDVVTMDQAAFASDGMGSINSTISFVAPYQGIPNLYLGLHGDRLGYDFLTETYGLGILKAITGNPNSRMPTNESELAEAFNWMSTNRFKPLKMGKNDKEVTASRKILDFVLNNNWQ